MLPTPAGAAGLGCCHQGGGELALGTGGFADGTGEGTHATVSPVGTEGPSLTPSGDFLP